MVDQFASRGLLDFNTEYVHSILSCTKNNADPKWDGNKDPFDQGFLAVVWHLLGSKTRTPGQYKCPKVNTPDSRTNEFVHWSVREKMEQSVKAGKEVVPSKALQGFTFEEESRAWVFKKGAKESFVLPEVELPEQGSMQMWLCADWLKGQE